MNESRPSVARANKAARRNYLIMSITTIVLTTAAVVVAFVMYK